MFSVLSNQSESPWVTLGTTDAVYDSREFSDMSVTKRLNVNSLTNPNEVLGYKLTIHYTNSAHILSLDYPSIPALNKAIGPLGLMWTEGMVNQESVATQG